MKLKDLKPGEMFRREIGAYRYVVSDRREGSCGNVSIYCHNLDGPSDGYWHRGGEDVIRLSSESPEQQEPKYFWMCFVEGGESPKCQHVDYCVAVREAERLARLTRKRVHLLSSISSVVSVPPVEHTELRWEKYPK